MVHHVFFWLKDAGSEKDRDRLIKGLQTLASIPGILKLHIGLPAETEQREVVDSSYQVTEIIFFKDLADQAAYQEHPIHQQFVADCAHLW